MVMLTLSLLAVPFATTAQPRGTMPLIGVLELGSQQAPLGSVVHGTAHNGFGSSV
jgi:hypothetical protein